MKVAYRKEPDDTRPGGYVYLPLLTVRLFRGNSYNDVRCLMDSGADDCLFHASVARNLGINVTSGEPKDYIGIGGQAHEGYLHTVDLQIFGFNERVKIEAGFSEYVKISLLGQSGFFENYEVTFRGYRKSFEIKSRTHIRPR